MSYINDNSFPDSSNRAEIHYSIWKALHQEIEDEQIYLSNFLRVLGKSFKPDRIIFWQLQDDFSMDNFAEWRKEEGKSKSWITMPSKIVRKFADNQFLKVDFELINKMLNETNGYEPLKEIRDRWKKNQGRVLYFSPVLYGFRNIGTIMIQVEEGNTEFVNCQSSGLELSCVENYTKILGMRLLNKRRKTDQLDFEDSIFDKQENYQNIFANLHDTYFRLDGEFILALISPSAETLFGHQLNILLKRSFLSFFPSDKVKNKFVEEINRKNQLNEFEIKMEKNDGKKMYVSINANITKEKGKIVKVEGIIRDITRRKMLEEQLIRAERMAAVGTLAGGVAHEFNNINLAILGYAELGIYKKGDDKETATYFETIRRSALRAKNITSNLLTFSKTKKGRPGVGNITGVVKDTVKMISHEINSQGIDLMTIFKEVPDTIMDSNQIGQVILNMLINAQHALIDNKEKIIKIETGVEDDQCFFRITDNGIGIPADNMKQVFSPFFTTKGEHSESKTAFSKVKGTGLGLSVSHTIISNHKGTIDVDSKDEEGTVFTVKLPLLPVEEKRMKSSQFQVVSDLSNLSVLVVDDEMDLLSLMENYLVSFGCKVTVATNGYKALEKLKKERFDLILVDLQMPIMSGSRFIKKVSEIEKEVEPVIIVMTGKIDADNENIHDKVYKIVSKPFKLQHMLKIIEEAAMKTGKNT
ncbi:MAG: response regulator [Deltaproteobacteria bacterium]|jgi:PAS domain S-box-containing protein|nr:response regulator [Deltaproteobacteria bacterium]